MRRFLQHPFVLVFVCLSLIGTPVTYRGGASNPHPHMFFEFLMDAETGAFDHHDGAGHSNEREHPDRGHDRVGKREQAAPRANDPGDRFGPTLSSFVIGDVGQLAFILTQSILPGMGDPATAYFPGGQRATGIAIAPPAPPPR